MLFDLVDRAFVINLESRPDRRRETIDELTTRFGADVVNAKVEFVAAVRPDGPGDFESVGARGVAESYLKVLKLARDRGLSSVLVFEDDAEFEQPDDVIARAAALAAATPGWHYASIGHLRGFEAHPPPYAAEAVRREIGADVEIPEGAGTVLATDGDVSLVQIRGGHTGNHCLLFRAEIFDDLIAHFERCIGGEPGNDVIGPIPADGIINTFSWINPAVRIVVSPSLCGQRSSRSDVTPHWVDRLGVFQSAVAAARSLKRKVR